MKQASGRSRRGSIVATCVVAVGAVLMVAGPSQSETRAPARANKYIGAAKCKNCHNKDEGGNQFAAWEHAKHSKAFETLGSDKAKQIAADMGIEDPQKADQCLKCHTTAFGADKKMIKKGFKMEAGVQCESCHGPGDDHLKARFKAAAAEDADQTPPPGEIITEVTREICVQCHNEESPTMKDKFCFYEGYKAIRHARPGAEAKKIMCDCGACGCEEGCPVDQ